MPARETDVVHTRAVNGEVRVPDGVEHRLMSVLDDVATAASRRDLLAAIEAVYSVHGLWEEWLAEEARRV